MPEAGVRQKAWSRGARRRRESTRRQCPAGLLLGDFPAGGAWATLARDRAGRRVARGKGGQGGKAWRALRSGTRSRAGHSIFIPLSSPRRSLMKRRFLTLLAATAVFAMIGVAGALAEGVPEIDTRTRRSS